jgi:hypothetical protein
MKPSLILALLLLAVSFSAQSSGDGIYPVPTPDGANRQLVCSMDQHGRFVRVEIYGFTVREVIQALAAVAHESVVIDDCPNDILSAGLYDLSFEEVVHRTLRPYGFTIEKQSDKSYRVVRTTQKK